MKFSKKIALSAIAGLIMATAGTPAFAALSEGARAPDFNLHAAKAGKPFDFSLRDARRRGPVVVYFFPAAFTQGCTIEAHLFAEASDDFNRLGATVVGVTAGAVDRVAEFSRAECRDKFAVAADPGARVAAQYDTLMRLPNATLSGRTSYVIAPNGTVLMSYTDMNPQQHIQKAMDAVRAWKAKHR